MQLLFSKTHPDAVIPEYKTAGASGFDFSCISALFLEPWLHFIPTGLRVRVPDGCGLFLFPRSSTYKMYGLRLANSVGIIDSDYCGPQDELFFAYVAERAVHIPKHARIGQWVILPVVHCDIQEADWENAASRWGFGSTGV